MVLKDNHFPSHSYIQLPSEIERILVPTPKTSKEAATKEDFILSEVKTLLAVCAYFTPTLTISFLLVEIKYLCIDFTFPSNA
jgi:hypothetical protein